MTIRINLFLLTMLPASLCLAEASWFGQLELPTHSSVTWVGQNIVQNGLPVDVLAFSSRQSIASVVNHFRRLWGDDGSAGVPGFLEIELGDWLVISSLQHDVNVVVQLSVASVTSHAPAIQARTSGYISAMDMRDQAFAGRDPILPGSLDAVSLPAGSVVKSRTVSRDLDSQAVTLIAINDLSASQNATFFRDHLQGNGWRDTLNWSDHGVTSLGFGKQRRHVGVTIANTGSGQSVMLLVQVTHE